MKVVFLRNTHSNGKARPMVEASDYLQFVWATHADVGNHLDPSAWMTLSDIVASIRRSEEADLGRHVLALPSILKSLSMLCDCSLALVTAAGDTLESNTGEERRND